MISSLYSYHSFCKDEELRRRQQENTLFMQAHQLNSLLDQQEQALGGGSGVYDSAGRGHIDLQSGRDQGMYFIVD